MLDPRRRNGLPHAVPILLLLRDGPGSIFRLVFRALVLVLPAIPVRALSVAVPHFVPNAATYVAATLVWRRDTGR